MGINGTVLNMTQYASVSAWIVAMGALLNVALNIWLIPIYGTTGAAIATAASLATWNILLSIAVYRRLSIRVTAFGL
jgi:O-antigen/teichoic acid export membrane protein